MTEYLDSNYFIKKYGVNAYVMTEYRKKSNFKLIRDEKTRVWKYPKEAEEEIKEFCEAYKRRAEIAETCIAIGQLKRLLGVSEYRVLDFIKENNIEVTLVNRFRYIDKKYIDFFKENLKPAKRNKNNYCPICNSFLNDLGEGEKYCKPCGKFFKKGREITYSESGEVIYIRRMR